jgi:hypothetical protein
MTREGRDEIDTCSNISRVDILILGAKVPSPKWERVRLRYAVIDGLSKPAAFGRYGAHDLYLHLLRPSASITHFRSAIEM